MRLADGTFISADAVIAGVGITPNVRLAAEAGLQVGNGITTDARLRTSDPDIYAAADVADAYHPLLGTSGSSTGTTRCTSRRPPPRRCSGRTPPTT